MVQQESKFFQVMMQRMYIQIVRQQFFVQKMKTATTIQENAEDIYAEAVEINEERAAKKECFEDEADDEDIEEVENEADDEAAADAE